MSSSRPWFIIARRNGHRHRHHGHWHIWQRNPWTGHDGYAPTFRIIKTTEVTSELCFFLLNACLMLGDNNLTVVVIMMNQIVMSEASAGGDRFITSLWVLDQNRVASWPWVAESAGETWSTQSRRQIMACEGALQGQDWVGLSRVHPTTDACQHNAATIDN